MHKTWKLVCPDFFGPAWHQTPPFSPFVIHHQSQSSVATIWNRLHIWNLRVIFFFFFFFWVGGILQLWSCQFGNLTSQVPQVHCIQYYQSRGWGPWLELNKKQAWHLESFVLYFAFDPGEDLARRHPVRADRHRAQCSRPWAKGWRPVQVKNIPHITCFRNQVSLLTSSKSRLSRDELQK